jgi:hypothetical protein
MRDLDFDLPMVAGMVNPADMLKRAPSFLKRVFV